MIARNSVFGYKDRPVAIQDVARELGVRYALEGTVRRSGEQMRVNVQLIDASTGIHLWANRFERSRDDVFAVQEEVIRHVVATLEVELTPGEQARLERPPTKISKLTIIICVPSARLAAASDPTLAKP